MTTRARVLITEGQALLSFAYDKRVVHRLKTEIPPPCRTFDERTKTWTVFQPHVLAAVGIVYDRYPDVDIDDRTGAGAGTWYQSKKTRSSKRASEQKSPAIDPDYAALHLLATAPAPLVDAAYRCLARLHHPDVGGDTTRMQQLNAARDSIRARRAS